MIAFSSTADACLARAASTATTAPVMPASPAGPGAAAGAMRVAVAALRQTGLAALSTLLTPVERPRVDAAGEGLWRALHRESWDDVVRDLRQRRVDAVLVSVACAQPGETIRAARVVREFPGVPAVAILSQEEGATPQAVLALGSCGVTRLVDVRHAAGWRELRDVLARERATDLESRILRRLAADLPDAPPDCRRFFELLFRGTTRHCTVRTIARELGVVPSTFMSRFVRAGLPAPKRYLALARLTRAARLFENPGLSIASVANALEYSSPQSFGRHVRTLLGVTAGDFRARFDGEAMFTRFRHELVLPYRDALRRFSPLRLPVS